MEKKRVDTLLKPANQILVLDGNWKDDVTDARYAFSQIPTLWFADKASPLYRHLETASYLFADGHVKRYHPSQIGFTNPPIF